MGKLNKGRELNIHQQRIKKLTPEGWTAPPPVPTGKGRQVITHRQIEPEVAECILGFPRKIIWSDEKPQIRVEEMTDKEKTDYWQRNCYTDWKQDRLGVRGRKRVAYGPRAEVEEAKATNPLWIALKRFNKAYNEMRIAAIALRKGAEKSQGMKRFLNAKAHYELVKGFPSIRTALKVQAHIRKQLKAGIKPTPQQVEALWRES